MTFQIFKAFPPDREGPVAELHATSGDEAEIPIQVFREEGNVRARIFDASGGVAWEFELSDLLDGLRQAAKVIEA
ncbi:MAG: hypothetical protein QOC82_2696 [Frankiaceae bacterium]|nr:hypothetical protein [Frankiaceae bacterium]